MPMLMAPVVMLASARSGILSLLAALLLSAVAAARGFVLALTVAVAVGQAEGLLPLLAAGFPAVLGVSALLAACAMVWQGGETSGRYSLRACQIGRAHV